MKSLGDVLSPSPQHRPNRRRYRRNVGFVLDVSRHSSKLDRNAKVRLLVAVETMERRTKAKGCRNGLATLPGVLILRCLLLRFHNGSTGLCCPSIATLQDATGLCRQTIVSALARLEAIGVLVRTRRLVRVCLGCGAVVVRQASNLYAFRELSSRIAVQFDPKSRPIPRVHGIDANLHTGIKHEGSLGVLAGFSYAAISARRAKAGFR